MKGAANCGCGRDEISFAVGWFLFLLHWDGWMGWRSSPGMASEWEWNAGFLIFDASVDRNRTMYEHIERLIF
jgi:hypothetical protein